MLRGSVYAAKTQTCNSTSISFAMEVGATLDNGE